MLSNRSVSPYFLRLFLPILLIFAIGTWFYGNKEINSTLRELRAREATGVKVATETLSGKIDLLSSDLLFLARHSTTLEAINQTTPKHLKLLAEDFAAFSESKKVYDQIRWLDENGMERVRVDLKQGKAVEISPEHLQDKHQRYYFIETLKLKPNQLFFSPLDLNIEHGQIEEPFKPMIRIATPINDQTGNNRGILITNYFGNDLLEAFTKAGEQTNIRCMLINRDGYWLKSDNPADEWGFMFNRPEMTLSTRHPEAWKHISQVSAGQLEMEDGLWTWETVYPLNRNAMINHSPHGISQERERYFWKSVSHYPAASLQTMRWNVWLKVVSIMGLFLSVYGLGCWKLAQLWALQAINKLKYRTVADFTYNWETWADSKGRYLYCSPSCFRITGHSAAEFQVNHQLLIEIAHPDDRAMLSEHMQRYTENGQTCELNFRIQLPDGQIRWLEHVCQPVFGPKGEYLGRRASNRDITERKQAEELLRKLSLAVQQSPSSIVITDLNANIEFANEAFFNATGYSHGEAIGQNPRILHSGKTPPEIYIAMWSNLSRGQSWKGEFINRRKDGSEYIELALISPIHQADGRITHYLAIKEDITERKLAETALNESHQQMYSLLNSMAEGAYGVDNNGYCQFVNRSFLRILGYQDESEIIGKHMHGLIHHSHPDGNPYPETECRMYAAYRHNQETHVTDEVFWRKDGIAVPVEYRSQPIMLDGIVSGAIATFIDISERLKADQAAQSAAQYARSLIEASLDPLVTISAEGKITDVNTSTELATGLNRQQLIGSDFADYFTDPNHARQGYQKVFSQGFVTDYSLSLRHVSGKITEVLYNATLYRDPNGKVLGVFAAARDVTELKQIQALLAKSEYHLRTIIENEPECIKLVDAEGRLLQMNPAGLKMVEADNLEQVIGKPVLNVIAPEYRTAFAELHQRVLAGESLQLEYEVVGLKGGRRWLETHAVPMKDTNGNVVHLAVTRDINDRKQTELQLRIAATVFESQEGMMVTNADNRILRVNKAFTDMTGYTAEEVVGRNPNFLQSERQTPEFYETMWKKLSAAGSWEGEIYNKRKNGEIFPDYLTITAVKAPNGAVSHYVATHMDITLRKAAAEEIERLAFYDPLTKLPNRRLLQDRLKPALAASQRNGRKGALLFIDLDNFKTLNDTLGHDMGDLLLQQVAKRLKTCIREGDTVARLGGDEFVVMLQDLDEQSIEAAKQAEIAGHKILTALNQPYQLGVHDYISTPSIGATLFGDHKQSAEQLLKHADIAMYQAKTSGRNALRFFDPKMQEAISARFSLEDELRKAVESGQFELYYQLQVDSDKHPLGAEALIRWRHPKYGIMQPADFIPLAEETGLIHPIGHWVLETACAQLKAWSQSPSTCHLVLAINVSGKQFFQTDFVAQVQEAIQRYSIQANLLKLELTESILIKKIDETIATMGILGKLGVQFSLDDFGTGYSSLQYLKKLPLNQLKIDQSFIRDIIEDSSDQAIVRTIIAMARSFNLNVIAEGVESEPQRQFLLSNGCCHYQGFLFSQPLPIALFQELLLTKSIE